MTTGRAAAGEIVSAFATEEAVYLKVAISDENGRHLGWAKGVRLDREKMRHYQRWIDDRLNEALQQQLPWDDEGDGNVRWMPPQP